MTKHWQQQFDAQYLHNNYKHAIPSNTYATLAAAVDRPASSSVGRVTADTRRSVQAVRTKMLGLASAPWGVLEYMSFMGPPTEYSKAGQAAAQAVAQAAIQLMHPRPTEGVATASSTTAKTTGTADGLLDSSSRLGSTTTTTTTKISKHLPPSGKGTSPSHSVMIEGRSQQQQGPSDGVALSLSSASTSSSPPLPSRKDLPSAPTDLVRASSDQSCLPVVSSALGATLLLPPGSGRSHSRSHNQSHSQSHSRPHNQSSTKDVSGSSHKRHPEESVATHKDSAVPPSTVTITTPNTSNDRKDGILHSVCKTPKPTGCDSQEPLGRVHSAHPIDGSTPSSRPDSEKHSLPPTATRTLPGTTRPMYSIGKVKKISSAAALAPPDTTVKSSPVREGTSSLKTNLFTPPSTTHSKSLGTKNGTSRKSGESVMQGWALVFSQSNRTKIEPPLDISNLKETRKANLIIFKKGKMQLLTSATAIPTSEHKVPLPLNSVAFKRIHLKLSTPKSSGILDTKSTPLGRNLKRPNSTAPEVNDTHLAVSSKTSKTLSTESNDKSLHRPIPSFKKRSNPKDPSRIPPFNASDDRKVAPPASSITPLPRDKKRMASSRDDPTTEQSEILNSKHHSPGSEGNAEPLQQHNLADKGGRPPRAPLSLKTTSSDMRRPRSSQDDSDSEQSSGSRVKRARSEIAPNVSCPSPSKAYVDEKRSSKKIKPKPTVDDGASSHERRECFEDILHDRDETPSNRPDRPISRKRRERDGEVGSNTKGDLGVPSKRNKLGGSTKATPSESDGREFDRQSSQSSSGSDRRASVGHSKTTSVQSKNVSSDKIHPRTTEKSKVRSHGRVNAGEHGLASSPIKLVDHGHSDAHSVDYCAASDGDTSNYTKSVSSGKGPLRKTLSDLQSDRGSLSGTTSHHSTKSGVDTPKADQTRKRALPTPSRGTLHPSPSLRTSQLAEMGADLNLTPSTPVTAKARNLYTPLPSSPTRNMTSDMWRKYALTHKRRADSFNRESGSSKGSSSGKKASLPRCLHYIASVICFMRAHAPTDEDGGSFSYLEKCPSTKSSLSQLINHTLDLIKSEEWMPIHSLLLRCHASLLSRAVAGRHGSYRALCQELDHLTKKKARADPAQPRDDLEALISKKTADVQMHSKWFADMAMSIEAKMQEADLDCSNFHELFHAFTVKQPIAVGSKAFVICDEARQIFMSFVSMKFGDVHFEFFPDLSALVS
ncbi:hypothetical protein BSLG_006734 [Batrachochytrium salamandrivorans]|nr:hypothetical protein BSLG_006734 [Batrachochytrium salamandrivorans]